MVKVRRKKKSLADTWERYNLWFAGAKFVPFVQYDKSYYTPGSGHFGDVYGQATVPMERGIVRDLSNFKREQETYIDERIKGQNEYMAQLHKTHAGEMHRRFDEIQQLFNDDESLSSSETEAYETLELAARTFSPGEKPEKATSNLLTALHHGDMNALTLKKNAEQVVQQRRSDRLAAFTRSSQYASSSGALTPRTPTKSRKNG